MGGQGCLRWKSTFYFPLSVCFANLVQSQIAVEKVESRKSTEERGCGWAESIVAGSTFYFPLSPL